MAPERAPVPDEVLPDTRSGWLERGQRLLVELAAARKRVRDLTRQRRDGWATDEELSEAVGRRQQIQTAHQEALRKIGEFSRAERARRCVAVPEAFIRAARERLTGTEFNAIMVRANEIVGAPPIQEAE